MPIPTLSLTETDEFNAIRTFLLSVVDSSVQVIRGQQNLTAEPSGSDFIVMWPILQSRLSTNIDNEYDNICLGSITDSTLTVTSIVNGYIAIGQLVLDIYGSLPDIIVSSQISGTPNSIGTYQLSKSRTLTQGTLYVGSRTDLVPTQLTVQLDVHGPNSANNAKVIEGLFRSEVATDIFTATGFDVTPLYCDEARYLPFINAEQQVEYRWTLDLQLQINPIITTPQQFADQLETTIEPPADITFVPGTVAGSGTSSNLFIVGFSPVGGSDVLGT